MEKIPTAEEIMIPYFLCDNEDKDLIKSAMIEFAKLHVEAALKEATIYFSNGCLYTNHNETKYDAHFTGCIRCGVRDYDVLEVRTLKEE